MKSEYWLDREAIRKVDLVSLSEKLGLEVRKVSGGGYIRCPFHDEKTPSLRLNSKGKYQGKFHCYGCAKNGDALDLIEKVRKVDRKEAVKVLEKYGYHVYTGSRPGVENNDSDIADQAVGFSASDPYVYMYDRGGSRQDVFDEMCYQLFRMVNPHVRGEDKVWDRVAMFSEIDTAVAVWESYIRGSSKLEEERFLYQQARRFENKFKEFFNDGGLFGRTKA